MLIKSWKLYILLILNIYTYSSFAAEEDYYLGMIPGNVGCAKNNYAYVKITKGITTFNTNTPKNLYERLIKEQLIVKAIDEDCKYIIFESDKKMIPSQPWRMLCFYPLFEDMGNGSSRLMISTRYTDYYDKCCTVDVLYSSYRNKMNRIKSIAKNDFNYVSKRINHGYPDGPIDGDLYEGPYDPCYPYPIDLDDEKDQTPPTPTSSESDIKTLNLTIALVIFFLTFLI